jgi:hypothetical protein
MVVFIDRGNDMYLFIFIIYLFIYLFDFIQQYKQRTLTQL